MRIKSIVSESRQIQRAIALIKLGARLQVLESETDLSYERLLRLYKEVQGESPARGMLPFSTGWFRAFALWIWRLPLTRRLSLFGSPRT